MIFSNIKCKDTLMCAGWTSFVPVPSGAPAGRFGPLQPLKPPGTTFEMLSKKIIT